jgi:glutathione S-transferase
MHPTAWPALYTLLTVVLMFVTGFQVARARGRYGIAAPATTGQPDFERVFRVQMNTLEQSVIFLPVLWVDQLYGTPSLIAGAGAVWLAGRVLYAVGYTKAAPKRSAGFLVSGLALGALLIDAAVGLARGW